MRYNLHGPRAMLATTSLLLIAAGPIPPADLQADVSILRQALETLHPGLYRYNTPAEMNARFAALSSEFAKPQTLRQAFLALSRFAATIKCGHTYPNILNQPDATKAELTGGQTRMPFLFRWLDGHIIVTADLTQNHILPPGTDILAINGTSAARILAGLLPYARADGANTAKRIANMQVAGAEKTNAFDIYWPLLFPAASPDLHLDIKRPGAPATIAVATPALTQAERASRMAGAPTPPADSTAPRFTWKTTRSGAAYLGMPDWALYNTKFAWRSWLDARLDEAARAKAPALIIDIRGNEGGDDVGSAILPHLITQPITLATYTKLVRARQTPPALNPYLQTWDNSFRNWGNAAQPLAQPWPTAPAVPYLSLREPGDTETGAAIIRPSAHPYRGKIYVLTDATNSSATFLFAQTIQRLHLGTLVGEPTGGNQRGINGGAFFFLMLPHTKLELDLPLIGTFPATPQPDAGLTPDMVIAPTADDIASGRDSVLEKVE
jgi:hypothetical protein